MKARDALARAADLLDGERDRTHGDKTDTFTTIAALWSAYLFKVRRDPEKDLTAADVGNLMALLKMVRSERGEYNEDDYIDMLGYIASVTEVRE